MVAGNEAVAAELESRGIRIIARLHEPPDEDKLAELRANLAQLGVKSGDLSDPRRMAQFLAQTADHPLATHVHTMVLRSMKRAVYSAEGSGHFGLSKRHYAHFTSPIRRYPDLVLHRQLAGFLAGEKGGTGALPTEYLKRTAAHCTEREQVADEASRALIEIKKVRFLQQQLDDKKLLVYDAVASKVTNYGMFVDVQGIAVTGMVHISMISSEFVRFDSAADSLRAGSETYRVGTKLRVQVARVDFNQRRADFALVRDGRTTIVSRPGASDNGRPPERKTRASGHDTRPSNRKMQQFFRKQGAKGQGKRGRRR